MFPKFSSKKFGGVFKSKNNFGQYLISIEKKINK